MSETFDLVVVGGGTAGCVVAARASEDPARRVLLIEAGPDPQPLPDVITDPRRQHELVLTSPYVETFEARRPDGSTFPLLAGRILGGGSSVNNLAATRPWKIDFDVWQGFGGDAWSYEAMLPTMRAIESDGDFPGDPLHGADGPLHIVRDLRLDDRADPAVRALVEAAGGLGMPICPDLNGVQPYGVCSSPYNRRDGIRQSTAVAYLDAARGRPNLVIRPMTAVTRLLVEGARVRGLESVGPGGRADVATDAVVLSAGVFRTPQVLMLSGIGPAADLERLGVRPVHDLPGVGANYHDHAVVYVTYQGSAALKEDFVIPKVRLVARSHEGPQAPDLHVFMRPSIRLPGLAPLLPVSAHLLEHRSAGRVSLATTDPTGAPIVDPGLLEHPADVEAMVGAMAFVERLVRQPALAALYGPLVTPDPPPKWREHVLSTYDTYHHGVGTCRIGREDDPAAVVDGRLRVRGLDGLWIADASVLPTVPHANTNLAAILVGEVAGQAITSGGM